MSAVATALRWEDGFPVLPALVDEDDALWWIWCTHCKSKHMHGLEPGHVAAHCFRKGSPYTRGYIGAKAPWVKNEKELRSLTESLPATGNPGGRTVEVSPWPVAPAWLYRFYDGDGAVLYIGITKNLGARFSDHARNSTWWDEARNVTVQWHPDWDAADAAETAAVRAEQPRHNVAKKREPLRRRVSANA
jgi:predicted GIY-YIG superfamily endonuclease